MKKIALLGDSIRLLGYGRFVPDYLGKEYTVFQPEDNCRFAKYLLRSIFDYEQELKDCVAIHWNAGIWDCLELFDDGAFTDIDEYVKTCVRIAQILKRFTPNIIFATTTPVRKPSEDPIRNETISQYNEKVVKALIKEGMIINDLHGLLSGNIEEYISDDMLHLSENGAKTCAKRVASIINELS